MSLILKDFILNEFAIDRFPTLIKQLGKARTGAIRYAQQGTGRKQPAATNIANTVIDAMQGKTLADFPELDDILNGIAQSVDTGRPLSVKTLFTILTAMPIINAREVQYMLDIGTRHAQRHVKALKIALPFVQKSLNRTGDLPHDLRHLRAI